MSEILKLQPAEIWKYFYEILQIPRPSKQEEKIIAFLLQFAQEHNLEAQRDEIGNVIIRKPATAGMEDRASIVLQSHVDMVCEKNSDVEHDFENDPINAYVDGDWVRARGTTLGGDDGIGVAAQLAILASTTIKHGPIECLFTVDEETGLTGAFELKPGFFQSNILLNLDSEDDGELFIGCAGGVDTEITFAYETEKIPSDFVAFEISVTGLKGGHSGDDIDKGLGNSIKIMNRFLWNSGNKYDIRISHIDAGNLRNAIPREAFATFLIHQEDKKAMKEFFEEYKQVVIGEYAAVEPKLSIQLKEADMPQWVIDEPAQYDLLNSLYGCPHGVIAMSHEIEGLVETSTNLASVKFIQDNQILVTTSQRSSIDSAMTDIAHMVESVFRLANANVIHTGRYPGWKPNTNSEILNITKSSYQLLFKEEPLVRAIHAGLECGLFLEKYPTLDMISFGPTIRGAHSPDERLSISTTKKFWDLLLHVLEHAPKA